MLAVDVVTRTAMRMNVVTVFDKISYEVGSYKGSASSSLQVCWQMRKLLR